VTPNCDIYPSDTLNPAVFFLGKEMSINYAGNGDKNKKGGGYIWGEPDDS